jgi:SAM-dependent methyltransferase
MLHTLGVGTLLDMGCADGVLRATLPRSAPWTVGLDASATLLRHHPPPVMRADAARQPFVDGTFDAVTALNVLYHPPHTDDRLPAPMTALREARRVLHAGGHLLAATIARDGTGTTSIRAWPSWSTPTGRRSTAADRSGWWWTTSPMRSSAPCRPPASPGLFATYSDVAEAIIRSM